MHDRIADFAPGVEFIHAARGAHHHGGDAGNLRQLGGKLRLLAEGFLGVDLAGVAMGVGMALDGVVGVLLAGEEIPVPGHAPAHDKERGRCAVPAQLVHHLAGGVAHGAVVIGEGDHAEAAVVGLGVGDGRHIAAEFAVGNIDMQERILAGIERICAVGKRQADGTHGERGAFDCLRACQGVKRGAVRFHGGEGGGKLRAHLACKDVKRFAALGEDVCQLHALACTDIVYARFKVDMMLEIVARGFCDGQEAHEACARARNNGADVERGHGVRALKGERIAIARGHLVNQRAHLAVDRLVCGFGIGDAQIDVLFELFNAGFLRHAQVNGHFGIIIRLRRKRRKQRGKQQ